MSINTIEIGTIDPRVREMFDRYHPLALETARRMYPSLDHEAIASSAMLRGWRNLDKINLKDADKWFIRATVHSGIDQARQEGRHSTQSLDSLPRHLEPSDPTYQPERVTLNTELGNIISRAVNTLPRTQRQIVILRLYEEVTEQEGSDIAGYPLGTVKSSLNRARTALQKDLSEIRQQEHTLPGLGATDILTNRDELETFILDETTRSLMFSVAMRMTGNRANAEDAVQDAQLAAWEKMDQYHGGSMKAWAIRIVVNQVKDIGRRLQRRPTSDLPEYFEPMDPDISIDPVRKILGNEILEAVHRALNKLPDDQQICVELCDIQGMSYEEIAQVEKVSIGTIKSRLSRAREKIRKFLCKNYPELVDQFEKFTAPEESKTAS
jgi:RNA polymerase sigma-70 factor, ECF subfamily